MKLDNNSISNSRYTAIFHEEVIPIVGQSEMGITDITTKPVITDAYSAFYQPLLLKVKSIGNIRIFAWKNIKILLSVCFWYMLRIHKGKLFH
ncbi:hypothetical protein Q6W85_002614 [Salmonella enterica]|nr:hypothetical protein [Salmonella enterica]ELK9788494.1 hypothetical protein [Salmonella enterica]ELK9827318.1 hypothetical protein [Salmonella enterica]